jgi:hypothetical protein
MPSKIFPHDVDAKIFPHDVDAILRLSVLVLVHQSVVVCVFRYALGYYLNMGNMSSTPLLRKGGAVIVVNDMPYQWDTPAHDCYRRFFEEVAGRKRCSCKGGGRLLRCTPVKLR